MKLPRSWVRRFSPKDAPPADRRLGAPLHMSIPRRDQPLLGFDPAYYLRNYPDVRAAGFDPLEHFLAGGWSEGRNPSAGFSTIGYLDANPDVRALGVNPLLHFLAYGLAEGRTGWRPRRLVSVSGGGFGNRFPPIASGMRIAARYGWDFSVVWEPQEEFELRLSDIFAGPLPFRVITREDLDPEGLYIPPVEREWDNGRPYVVPNGPGTRDVHIAGFCYFAHEADAVTAVHHEGRDPFMVEAAQRFLQLQPTPYVKGRIEELSSRMDPSRTLGVHIRRQARQSIYGAMEPTRDDFPMSHYVDGIRSILWTRPELETIYVATNRLEARDEIAAAFPGRVLSNERVTDGWSGKAQQIEAFAEMFVLGRCGVVLRQPWTTFSLFSCLMGVNTMVTMSLDPKSPDLDWTDWRRIAAPARGA